MTTGISAEQPDLWKFSRTSERRNTRSPRLPLAVEDLLSRPTHEPNTEMMKHLVTGKRVLVTGAGGSIGGALCRQIAAMGCERLMIVDHSELAIYQIGRDLAESAAQARIDDQLCDVRDEGQISRLMSEFRPDLVFHAAALKHVPIVERHLEAGIQTNVGGTINVADAARRAGAEAMVLISTDKAVRPTSLMGATKRAAEAYCTALDAQSATRFIVVRFGNVMGSSGSVVPLFQEQLDGGGPLTVTHPQMQRYFMTVSEAVGLVLMATGHGLTSKMRRSIYLLNMGKPLKIVDLAERMIRLAGFRPGDVEILFTGPRQGEKLQEELLHSSETLHPTELEGVLIAEPPSGDHGRTLEKIASLSRMATRRDTTGIAALLAECVPEYQPAIGGQSASRTSRKQAAAAVRMASLTGAAAC